MKNRTLLWSRRILAAIVFGIFFLAFAFVAVPAARLAHFQIGPALLGGGVIFLIAIALLTLCFGRVYCAALCPLGSAQDILGRIVKKSRKKPLSPHFWLRLLILAIFAGALFGGFLFVYGIMDPYSAFGRMAGAVFGPLVASVNNLFAMGAEAMGLSFFTVHEIQFAGWPAFGAGLITLLLLCLLVWTSGRVWCNYCPVGTALGLIGRKSLARISLDTGKCVACGRCERTCKTGCIDIKKGEVDNSRCVACQSCAPVCPTGAINYGIKTMKANTADERKRAFLHTLLPGAAIAALLASKAEAAQTLEINRPDVTPTRKRMAARPTPLTPPGAMSIAHFGDHCVGCQLCVNACPNRVLKTSLNGPGLLQPGLSYEYGYCRPNCVKCGEVCPAGAIAKISREQKAAIRIGVASVDFERCIVNADKTQCTACQRICPNEAISLASIGAEADSLKRPVVDQAKCTGCGACEYVCAARPVAAIVVNGLPTHEILEKA